jgi:hypothetical protein
MRKTILLPLALLSVSAVAQPPAAPTPQFSTVEVTALSTTIDKIKQTQETLQNLYNQLHAEEADIAKAHPGFHFDEHTNSLVADPKPTPKPDAAKTDAPKPEAKK